MTIISFKLLFIIQTAPIIPNSEDTGEKKGKKNIVLLFSAGQIHNYIYRNKKP